MQSQRKEHRHNVQVHIHIRTNNVKVELQESVKETQKHVRWQDASLFGSSLPVLWLAGSEFRPPRRDDYIQTEGTLSMQNIHPFSSSPSLNRCSEHLLS